VSSVAPRVEPGPLSLHGMARLVEANEVNDRLDGVVLTNDGVRLAFSQWGTDCGLPAVVLIHGWSGSRFYFKHSVQVRSSSTLGVSLTE
jgi:hypothetical protein